MANVVGSPGRAAQPSYSDDWPAAGWFARLFGAVLKRRELLPAREFYCSVTCVTHHKRQQIISETVDIGMRLPLRLDEENPRAVAVLNPRGEQIGSLDTRLALVVREWIREGGSVTVSVSDVIGGDEAEKSTYGVTVLVRLIEPSLIVDRAPCAART